MHPGYGFILPPGLEHYLQHLFQVHSGTVVYFSVWPAYLQESRIYQGSGIDDHVGSG